MRSKENNNTNNNNNNNSKSGHIAHTVESFNLPPIVPYGKRQQTRGHAARGKRQEATCSWRPLGAAFNVDPQNRRANIFNMQKTHAAIRATCSNGDTAWTEPGLGIYMEMGMGM